MLICYRGEPGIGKWSVVVKDTEVNGNNGTFDDWKLSLWGECIDPSTQELLPMPTDDDNEDDEIISAHVTTTTHSGPVMTGVSGNPSDHVHRPINAKPTANPTPLADSTNSTTSGTATPSATPSSTDKFLHYFPTFGVSKRTQIWIYGALTIIVLFCAGLGTYFYLQRRKRQHDEYEFDILHDDDDGDNHNVNGGGAEKGKRVKKRAGELYDAFAGESDEELLADENGEEGYRDEDRSANDDGDDGDRGRSQSKGG